MIDFEAESYENCLTVPYMEPGTYKYSCPGSKKTGKHGYYEQLFSGFPYFYELMD